MKNNISKERYGLYFYYGCLITALVAMLVLLIFVKSPSEKEVDVYITWLIKTAITFYLFIILLPIGSYVKEITSGEYNKSKIKVKVIVNIAIIIIGSFVMFLNQIFDVDYKIAYQVSRVSIFVVIAITIFLMAPTLTPEEKKKALLDKQSKNK